MERDRDIFQQQTPDTIEVEAKRLKESRKEVKKEILGCVGTGVLLAGGGAMVCAKETTVEGTIIKGVGTGIFVTAMLAPGVAITVYEAKRLVGKWKGNSPEG